MTKPTLKEIISYSLVLLLIAASYIRLYFSVDFQDESFYITLPYRFILGDLPIHNESSICQFAGILLLPFYKLFYSFQHNSQGIVLYGRHLFFIFYSILGCLTYTVFKKELGKSEALLFACICILYVPWNVLGLSYNTLSMLFFTAASLFAFLDYQNNFQGRSNLILAGFFASLSAFSYPPLILPILVLSILIAVTSGYKRTYINFLLGSLPVALISLFLIIKFKNDLPNLYFWLKQTGHTDKSHSVIVFAEVFKIFFFFKIVTFFALGVIIFNLQQSKKIFFSNSIVKKIIMSWCYLSFIFLPFSFLLVYIFFYLKVNNSVLLFVLLINCSLLGPFYFLLTNRRDLSKKLFLLIWLPSFLAGILTAFVSGSLYLNSMVGFFPAFMVSTILVYLAFKKFFYDDLADATPPWSYLKILPTLSIMAFLSFLLFFKYTIVIRDQPISALQHRVTSGPYKFLYTNYQTSLFLDELNEDLSSLTQIYHPKSIFVYPLTFGVYLFTNLKPMTNSIWLDPNADNNPTFEYFKRQGEKPQIAVLLKGVANIQEDNLYKFLNSGEYLALLEKHGYSIYILKKFLNGK